MLVRRDLHKRKGIPYVEKDIEADPDLEVDRNAPKDGITDQEMEKRVVRARQGAAKAWLMGVVGVQLRHLPGILEQIVGVGHSITPMSAPSSAPVRFGL